MSLITTAKAGVIELHAWLADVLTRPPTTKACDIDILLPIVSRTARWRPRTFTSDGRCGTRRLASAQ